MPDQPITVAAVHEGLDPGCRIQFWLGEGQQIVMTPADLGVFLLRWPEVAAAPVRLYAGAGGMTIVLAAEPRNHAYTVLFHFTDPEEVKVR